MKDYPLSKVFQLIEPGPVVLVTTSHKGRANVMTMSWHMAMEFTPPQIACVISPGNHSFEAVRKTRECVIAIPGADLVPRVVDIGNCSGQDVDKFAAFGLTPMPAAKVTAPLVAECLANIECRVVDTRLVNKYALFILEAVKAWTNPQRKDRRRFHANGDGTFAVDGRTLDLRKKMVKWQDTL
ncbi:flavin reductase [Opitutaceae bacterium TAV5]|nr:flavin reductase [Opitutaceae bacterium TAV5]